MALIKSQDVLKAGQKAPDFSLIGTDGKMYSLGSFNGKLKLLIFMCNHCPYVQCKFDAISSLHEKYKEHVAVIGINPNDSDNYPEDSFEKMKEYAKKYSWKFHYLYDELQEVAEQYGAVCTPDPFLLSKDNIVIYHGRLNSQMSPEEKATANDMEDAIEAALAKKPVPKPFLPSQGCSIKWKK